MVYCVGGYEELYRIGSLRRAQCVDMATGLIYGMEHNSGFEMGRCVRVEWNRVGGGNGETEVLCGRHHV